MSNRLDIAYKKWKRDSKKLYDRFFHWSRLQLQKQQDIDYFGYAKPRRKEHHKPERDTSSCSLYLDYEEHRLCDICGLSCLYNRSICKDEELLPIVISPDKNKKDEE